MHAGPGLGVVVGDLRAVGVFAVVEHQDVLGLDGAAGRSEAEQEANGERRGCEE